MLSWRWRPKHNHRARRDILDSSNAEDEVKSLMLIGDGNNALQSENIENEKQKLYESESLRARSSYCDVRNWLIVIILTTMLLFVDMIFRRPQSRSLLAKVNVDPYVGSTQISSTLEAAEGLTFYSGPELKKNDAISRVEKTKKEDRKPILIKGHDFSAEQRGHHGSSSERSEQRGHHTKQPEQRGHHTEPPEQRGHHTELPEQLGHHTVLPKQPISMAKVEVKQTTTREILKKDCIAEELRSEWKWNPYMEGTCAGKFFIGEIPGTDLSLKFCQDKCVNEINHCRFLFHQQGIGCKFYSSCSEQRKPAAAGMNYEFSPNLNCTRRQKKCTYSKLIMQGQQCSREKWLDPVNDIAECHTKIMNVGTQSCVNSHVVMVKPYNGENPTMGLDSMDCGCTLLAMCRPGRTKKNVRILQAKPAGCTPT